MTKHLGTEHEQQKRKVSSGKELLKILFPTWKNTKIWKTQLSEVFCV